MQTVCFCVKPQELISAGQKGSGMNKADYFWLVLHSQLCLTLQGLLKATKVLQEDYGSMHLNFGRPLSVRQLCQGKINRCHYNLIPR